MKVRVLREGEIDGRSVTLHEVIEMDTAKALIEIQKGSVEALESTTGRGIENRDPHVRRS